MRVVGLGIDLIAISRARQFLKEHRQKAMDRLLTHSEKKQLRRKSLSALQFSKMFTAKEAFFKATGESGMGLEGFGSLEVKFLPHKKFQVRSLNSKRRSHSKPQRVVGSFFQDKVFVGAQVVLWSET